MFDLMYVRRRAYLLALTIKNRIASALAEVTQLDYLKSKE